MPFGPDAANAGVVSVADVQAAVRADRDTPGSRNERRRRRAAIAAEAVSGPGHRGDDAVRPDAADAVVARVGDVDAAVGADGHAVRLGDLCQRCLAAIAAEPRAADSGPRLYRRARGFAIAARTVALVEHLGAGIVGVMRARAPTAHGPGRRQVPGDRFRRFSPQRDFRATRIVRHRDSRNGAEALLERCRILVAHQRVGVTDAHGGSHRAARDRTAIDVLAVPGKYVGLARRRRELQRDVLTRHRNFQVDA